MLQFSVKTSSSVLKIMLILFQGSFFFHTDTHTHVITDYLVTGFLPFCSTTSKEAVDSWQTVSASAATAQQLPSPSCYVVMLILQYCCDVCVALLCFALRDFLLCPWRLNVITALYTSECSRQWTVTLICHFHLVSFLAACKSLADALWLVHWLFNCLSDYLWKCPLPSAEIGNQAALLVPVHKSSLLCALCSAVSRNTNNNGRYV